MWQAMNQAAGSGTVSVAVVHYLLSLAKPSGLVPMTDTVAFLYAAEPFQIRANIYHRDPASEAKSEPVYWLSTIATFGPMNEKDVQGCVDLTKNIVEYCLGHRQDIITAALDACYEDMRKQERPTYKSTVRTTPVSPSSDYLAPSKKPR